jgi:hypothetical protein
MKKLCILFAVVSVVIGMTGCIESSTIVRVNRDGSGEVEETLLMRTDIIQMFMGMSEETGEETENFELLSREQLEKKAEQMGAGVELKAVENITTSSQTGYRALFTFEDINSLQVNENPDENVPGTGSPDDGAPQREIITFQFEEAEGNKPASLVINLPAEDVDTTENEPEEMPEEQTEHMINMFREIFKDMKIDVSLEVDGRITETNATHTQGSRIILIAIDFERIIQNEQVFRELAMANPDSLEETKEILKDVPGIKVELQDRVELQFK